MKPCSEIIFSPPLRMECFSWCELLPALAVCTHAHLSPFPNQFLEDISLLVFIVLTDSNGICNTCLKNELINQIWETEYLWLSIYKSPILMILSSEESWVSKDWGQSLGCQCGRVLQGINVGLICIPLGKWTSPQSFCICKTGLITVPLHRTVVEDSNSLSTWWALLEC